jgi:2-polyprenyl-3-methyl-5-hydroxy-6-metoxy-1,4-benzoquinol methylase
MWGSDPTYVAILAAETFAANGLMKILIPGIGYGRNAYPFLNNGMTVTGIEISETAIRLAENYFDHRLKIYHGSVKDMPFDDHVYDGVFCYALIHLLDEHERKKLITESYNQLAKNGLMVFIAITKEAYTYAQGTLISTDRYQQFGGVNIFFYDEKSIEREFGSYGLLQIKKSR